MPQWRSTNHMFLPVGLPVVFYLNDCLALAFTFLLYMVIIKRSYCALYFILRTRRGGEFLHYIWVSKSCPIDEWAEICLPLDILCSSGNGSVWMDVLCQYLVSYKYLTMLKKRAISRRSIIFLYCAIFMRSAGLLAKHAWSWWPHLERYQRFL